MKRFPQPVFALIALLDWARLAAYIDGEGCIVIAQQVHKLEGDARRRYDYMKVSVCGTDARLAAWLLKTFGGNAQWRDTNKKHNRWKPCFYWNICGTRGAEALTRCLPFFIVKDKQVAVGLAFQATVSRVGVKGHPPEIHARRRELKAELHQLNVRGPRAAAAAAAVH